MKIRGNLIIDIETDVSDNESSLESLKFLVDEDLKDLGYNVHSLQVQPAKRHPDLNGVLPLTPEELKEFTELFFDNKDVVNRVYYDGNCIVVEWKEPDNNEFGQLYLDEVSAILYIANLFELEVTE